MPKNCYDPFAPIEIPFDIRPLLDHGGVPYRGHPRGSTFESKVLAYAPMAVPAGATVFHNFQYTKSIGGTD